MFAEIFDFGVVRIIDGQVFEALLWGEATEDNRNLLRQWDVLTFTVVKFATEVAECGRKVCVDVPVVVESTGSLKDERLMLLGMVVDVSSELGFGPCE